MSMRLGSGVRLVGYKFTRKHPYALDVTSGHLIQVSVTSDHDEQFLMLRLFFQLRTTGLNVSYQQSSIYLPRQTFGAPDSRVVSLVYPTLNDVLALANSSSDDISLYPNTTVVSSTVLPRPSDLLNDPPVKIILQNRGVLDFNNNNNNNNNDNNNNNNNDNNNSNNNNNDNNNNRIGLLNENTHDSLQL